MREEDQKIIRPDNASPIVGYPLSVRRLDKRLPGDCLSEMFRRPSLPQFFNHGAELR
jgi:hypothetical protein